MSGSEDATLPSTSLEEELDQTLVSSCSMSSGSHLGVSGVTDSGESGTSNQSSKLDMSNGSKSGNSNLSKSKETIDVSHEKLKKKPTGYRVVQSRFKAAAAAKNSSGNNSNSKNGSNNSNNSSSNSKNRLNTTLISASSTNNVAGSKISSKTRPVRASAMGPTTSGPISRSTVNIAKTDILPNRLTTNKPSPRSQISQSTTNLASKSTGLSRPQKSTLRPSKPKLHSTILNATVLGDKTHKEGSSNVFSTTLVGGMAPGARNLDLTGAVLPELPDISAIRLDSLSNENGSGEITVLSSVSEKDSTQDSNDCSIHEVTAEDIENEYLRYCQWVQVNLSSKDAFFKQLNEAQNQIAFLEQLISEKQTQISESKQMTELVLHHQQVTDASRRQTELLESLIDALPASEDGMQTMSRELEKSLHQVKMDNLYIPENHKKYRDQLTDAVMEQVSLLTELDSLLEPRSHHLQSTISLLDDLQNTTRRVQQCENEVNKAARLSVQEVSLQIGAQQRSSSSSASLLEAQ